MSKIGQVNKMNKQVNKMNKLLAATIGMFLVFRGVIAIADPLFETSFEEGTSFNEYIASGWSSTMPFNNIKYWPAGVEVLLDGSTVRSGNKSLKLYSPYTNRVVNVGTPLIAVQENTRVRISGWMKPDNVVCGAANGYTARMGFWIYGSTGGVVDGGSRAFGIDAGTQDWKRYETTCVVPAGGANLRIWCELKNCSGTAWFDDLRVEILDSEDLVTKMTSMAASIPRPVVIPKPWKEQYGQALLQPGAVCLETFGTEDQITRDGASAFILEMNGQEVTTNYDTLMLIGPPDNQEIITCLTALGISVDWEEFSDQGYLLYAGIYQNKNLILLVSTGPAGRYYALQTLRQIVVSDNGVNYIKEAVISDKPLYSFRGIVFGDLRRWYQGPYNPATGLFEGWSYKDRSHALKLNYVFLAGAGVSSYARQVLPFSSGDIQSATNFFTDCQNHFITPCVGVRPYKQTAYTGRALGGVMYSSDADINGVVANLTTLYNLGYRHLYVAFDDLPAYRFLEYEEDKAKFKTIAEAHLYFVGEVYRRLMKRCPEVKFRFLGVAYDGAENMPQDRKEYCRVIAGLPKEIEFVWTGSKSSDAQYYSGLNGDRKLMIWSNYYAGLYEKLTNIPVFEYPYRGGDASFHKHTTGHFFLPVDNAGSANLSWYTAADYMWNPEGYNPDDSAGRAMIKAVGKELYQLLPDYISFINGLTGNKGIPGFTSEERMTNLSRAKERLDSYMAEFEKLAGNEIYDALTKQARDLYADFNLLLEQYKTKPLPIIAKKAGMSPVIDGKLDDKCWKDAAQISDFLVLGRNIPAEVQTKVFLLYDEKNLYLGAVMFEPDIRKLKRDFKERDSAVFRDDSFEVFIGDVNALKNYYHIALNSTGAIYDAYLGKSEWNGKYSSATMVAEDCWTVEMAIPWTNFNFASKDRLSCNFARARRTAKTELTAYAPLLGTGNHLPHWFWTLKLQ